MRVIIEQFRQFLHTPGTFGLTTYVAFDGGQRYPTVVKTSQLRINQSSITLEQPPMNPFDAFSFKSETSESPAIKSTSNADILELGFKSVAKRKKTAVPVKQKVVMKPELNLSSEIAIGTASHYRIVINSLRGWKRTSNSTSSVDDFQIFLNDIALVQTDFPFMVLCTGILACQCRDMVAMRVTKELIAVVGGDLTAAALLALTADTIESVIKSCNYYRSKAKSLQKLASAVSLLGSVPDTFKGLVALPGIGPKIANLCLSVAFKHGGAIVPIKGEDWLEDDSLPSSPYFSPTGKVVSTSIVEKPMKEEVDIAVKSEIKQEKLDFKNNERKSYALPSENPSSSYSSSSSSSSGGGGGGESLSFKIETVTTNSCELNSIVEEKERDDIIDVTSPVSGGNHLTSPVSGGNLGGIIVDTHVHKVSKRIGWSKGAKNPEGTRKILEGISPPDHWDELTVLLIGNHCDRNYLFLF